MKPLNVDQLADIAEQYLTTEEMAILASSILFIDETMEQCGLIMMREVFKLPTAGSPRAKANARPAAQNRQPRGKAVPARRPGSSGRSQK